MGHAHECAAIPVEEVNLDQARPRRHRVVSLPTKAIGEAMDRNDLAELPARSAAGPAADVLDQVESAWMDLGGRLGAHPAHDFLRIGQEGEDCGGRGGDLGLAPDDERFIHWVLLKRKRHSSPQLNMGVRFLKVNRLVECLAGCRRYLKDVRNGGRQTTKLKR